MKKASRRCPIAVYLYGYFAAICLFGVSLFLPMIGDDEDAFDGWVCLLYSFPAGIENLCRHTSVNALYVAFFFLLGVSPFLFLFSPIVWKWPEENLFMYIYKRLFVVTLLFLWLSLLALLANRHFLGYGYGVYLLAYTLLGVVLLIRPKPLRCRPEVATRYFTIRN